MATSLGYGDKVFFPEEFGEFDVIKRKGATPGPGEYELNKADVKVKKEFPEYT